MRTRAGLTLIELLVALTILGVLIGLLTPALAHVMGLRARTSCVSNLRQVGLLLQAYAVDHQDALPSGSDTVQRITVPVLKTEFPVGGAFGFDQGSYAVLFPEHWSTSGWSRGLQCPGTPQFGSPDVVPFVEWGGTRAPFNRREFPQYYLSEAIALDPACLAPGYSGVLRGKLNRWADIVFPSQKAVLYESTAFCLPEPEQREFAIRWGQTFAWPTSVLAGDGSVTRRPIIDAQSLGRGGAQFNATYRTVNGIYGRDW
jgi:prepilin-type N-terminal cleavage/methylation domain-containing protein